MKRLFKIVALLVVVLGAVLLVRTAQFGEEPAPLPEAIKVDIEEEAALARFTTALQIPTISRGEAPFHDKEAFARFRQHLKASFPLVHSKTSSTVISGASLVFEWKGSNSSLEPILLMGHQDVVPVSPGTESEWEVGAFEGQRKGDHIYGRGTLDDKLAVIAQLEAAETLLQEGFQPKRTVFFAFGHDEEIGGRRGAAKIADYFKERKIKFAWVLDEGGAVVQGLVPFVSGPVALIGVAEKGYLTIELSTGGKGGHSSIPPKHTAIGVLSGAITKLEANLPAPRSNQSKLFFNKVGPRMSFGPRVLFANLWLFGPILRRVLSDMPSMDASQRTTTAVTMISGGVKDNVLPQSAKAVVNFRILPGDSIDSTIDHVRKVIDDDDVGVAPWSEEGDGFGSEPSSVSRLDSPGFSQISRALHRVKQDPELVVAPYLVLGATDSRYFAPIAGDVYRFMPYTLQKDDLGRIHGTNERIAVSDYFTTVKFFYSLLSDASGS